MNRQIIMLIMVIALVFLTVVQAFQINDLKRDINDGTISIGPGGATTGNTVRTGAVRQQAAPTMVGGC